MRKAIDIYGDKEHITGVNTKYVFFRFPDGSQDRLKSRKQDFIDVLEWMRAEMRFYDRMRDEVVAIYETEKEEFDKTKHYYSDEEIHEACLKDRFASIDMGLSNERYKTEWNRISGKYDIAIKAGDRYWKLYKIAKQLENAIGAM